MIQSKVYKSIGLILVFCPWIWGQHFVSGTVVDAASGEAVPEVEIYVLSEGIQVQTGPEGSFEFNVNTTGILRITAFRYGYQIQERAIDLPLKDPLAIRLERLNEELSEVIIAQQRRKTFQLKQLKDVEGTAIYAGKKSEVILVDQLTTNKATNNARQLYSQVVGLNIYDNGDAGLQLNIGGRGLDPNRTSNFNTRQNGYDISADVLGYPESYYTPPAEAVKEIQIVRGAASLQYGTQFGGLVNFKLHEPDPTKAFTLTSRQTVGSFDLLTHFTSVSGTVGKFGYYAYFNYKKGNGFRPNSSFNSRNTFAHFEYTFSEKTKLISNLSYLNYLAQQAGGLNDSQFLEDPAQSNRPRNWFRVDWLLPSLRLEHSFSENSEMSLQLFGLSASRKALGFRINRVDQDDLQDEPRELIDGRFRNWGAELRYLTRYSIFKKPSVFLIGAKYYQANNSEQQGAASLSDRPDFEFQNEEFPAFPRQSDFSFPNTNVAVFSENSWSITDKLTVTPGLRFEYIKTQSEGASTVIISDNAGNVLDTNIQRDDRTFERSFVLAGLGLSYKATSTLEIYLNASQNYRSVTFNDIRITNPGFRVDPNITDESGFTTDIGVRGHWNRDLRYDIGAFFLSYNQRIGLVDSIEDTNIFKLRINVGDAILYGFEGFADWNWMQTVFDAPANWLGSYFINTAITESEYTRSQRLNESGNQVEFVPRINFKTGLRFGYKDFLGTLQYTSVSRQFTDGTNSPRELGAGASGIIGEIPAYEIWDLSLSYSYKKWRLETGINNLLNTNYFTRRATGYPGPGIIPAEPRAWYATLQFTL